MSVNSNSSVFVSTNGQSMPDNFIFQTVDPSQDDDSDSDPGNVPYNSADHLFQQSTTSTGLKPGKKTKGRVKIKMEFIENKLRRYTTFSKRKTGIMKKAYELSTLTGTQVMLLVASETGHVYTFATRKLQPMITSDSGKALIQTCLNSPDPPPGTQSGNSPEQRMNPFGFEETDLSCVAGEEDAKAVDGLSSKPIFPAGSHVVTVQQPQPQLQQQEQTTSNIEQVIKAQRETTSIPIKTVSSAANPATSSLSSSSSSLLSLNNKELTNNNGSNTTSSISTMQIPLILSQGGAISMLQNPGQAISIPQVTRTSTTNTSVKPSALNRIVNNLKEAAAISQTNTSGELNTPLPVSTPSINLMQNMTPGIVMYQTPQGVVYATPTQSSDRTIFNFCQPPAAISMTQADHLGSQQFITIPVPLSGTPLMQLANPPTANNMADDTGQEHSPSKKSKK